MPSGCEKVRDTTGYNMLELLNLTPIDLLGRKLCNIKYGIITGIFQQIGIPNKKYLKT